MEYSDIENLISLFGSMGLGAIVGGVLVFLFTKSFLPAYLSEKAKNLASKEDIESITEKVESVKSDYSHLLEEVRSNYQLKHAAVEREKSTKKDVYMEAVEAITRSLNMISGFSNLNLDEYEITSNLSVDAGRIAKVQVVGGKETVESVNEYMAEIGVASLDLLLKRSELVERKNAIHLEESMRDKSQQEIDRYIAIMKNLNLQGNADEALWGTINRSVEFEQNQYKIYQANRDELWSIQEREHLEFTRECMERFFKISELLPAAVLAVRAELDLEIDKDEYMKLFYKNLEKGKQAFQSFLTRVEGRNA